MQVCVSLGGAFSIAWARRRREAWVRLLDSVHLAIFFACPGPCRLLLRLSIINHAVSSGLVQSWFHRSHADDAEAAIQELIDLRIVSACHVLETTRR